MRRFLALALLLAAAPCCLARTILDGDADKQADAFSRIYATFCLKHINELGKLRDRLAFTPRLPPEKAAGFLRGQPGDAWSVPDPSGQFVLALLRDKNMCMVYGIRADPAKVEKTFGAIANTAPSTMVTKQVQDEQLKTPHGPAHSISYEWTMSSAPRKILMSLTTTASDTAPLQALASVALISK